jgi:hypothetical protein
MNANDSYGCDRGEAVNLARNIRGRDACVVTDKGIDTLAEAVIRMDEELTKLYAATAKITSVTRAFDYLGNNINEPWVKVCFAHEDWTSRDAFAKALGSRRATHSPGGSKT